MQSQSVRGHAVMLHYRYHHGQSDPNEVKKLLADVKEIEVRVLPLP